MGPLRRGKSGYILLASEVSERRPGSPMSFTKPNIIDSLIFVLLLSGPPRLRRRDVTLAMRADVDWAVMIELIVWGSGFVWLFIRLYPTVVARGIIPRMWPPQVIGGMFVVGLFSSAWLAPSMVPTAYAISQFAIMLGFCWVFVRRFGPQTYLQHLFWGYLLLALAILLSWIVMPELVVGGRSENRVRGDLIAPAGGVAVLCLVLVLSGTSQLAKRALVIVTGLLLLLLAVSQTRTAYVAFFCFLVIGWMFKGPNLVKKSAPLLVTVMILAALFEFLPSIEQYVVRDEKTVSTMSARVPLWNYLMDITLRESPLIGLGYQSAVRILGPQFLPNIGNAHSVFVEIFVGGGIFGIVLFSLLYISFGLYSVNLMLNWRRSALALSVVGLFAVNAIMSITNIEGITPGPVGFTFWSLTALFPAVLDELRATQSTAKRNQPREVFPRTMEGYPV